MKTTLKRIGVDGFIKDTDFDMAIENVEFEGSLKELISFRKMINEAAGECKEKFKQASALSQKKRQLERELSHLRNIRY